MTENRDRRTELYVTVHTAIQDVANMHAQDAGLAAEAMTHLGSVLALIQENDARFTWAQDNATLEEANGFMARVNNLENGEADHGNTQDSTDPA